MAKTTIEWTCTIDPRTGEAHAGYTFNALWGCQRVSPGCSNCYAASLDKRIGGDHWKPDAKTGERRFRLFDEKHWNKPREWNEKATKLGVRLKVFCSSMADVFDDGWPDGVRDKLWNLIAETPRLDWLLLTKRPENFAKFLPWNDWGDEWPNVWLGCTAEDQEHADKRVPILLKTPAWRRFVSYEPALGPVDFRAYTSPKCNPGECCDEELVMQHPLGSCPKCRPALNWIIAGAESGPKARPMLDDWVRAVRDRCAEDGVSFFYKQQMHVVDGKKRIVSLPVLDGAQHRAWPTS